MASPLLTVAHQCILCIRRITPPCREFLSSRSGQIRGKKKLAKVPATVKVQLLQNIPGYGRRGTIVPITPGVMRNIWYPKRMASYVTMARLQELEKKDVAVERDPIFGTNRERRAAKAAAAESKAKEIKNLRDEEARIAMEAENDQNQEEVEAALTESHPLSSAPEDKMTPELATAILSRLLPPSIVFFRTPITVSSPTPVLSPTPKRMSPSLSSGAFLSAAAEAAAKESIAKVQAAQQIPVVVPTERTGIYGAVTTSDIAADLRAMLAEDKDGQYVSISAENISFVALAEEDNRIKHLGTFEIEIRLDNTSEIVRRSIKVNAQE